LDEGFSGRDRQGDGRQGDIGRGDKEIWRNEEMKKLRNGRESLTPNP